MAFKLVSAGGINVQPTIIDVMTSGSITVGDHISPLHFGGEYTGQLYCARLGAATADNTLFGIAVDSVNSATGNCKVILINSAQIWEADTTAATAVNQRFKANALSNYACIANSVASKSAAIKGNGVWFNIREVGATTDYKMLGRFNPPNNLGD